MGPITDETVFKHAECIVVRPQKGNYLFYNSQTDELHLIPPTGHAVYALCDGWTTVDDIVTSLSVSIDAQPQQLRDRVADFFAALESRGLLERTDA